MLLTSAFVQLNSAARLSSINCRLRYIFRPYSDLFVIYNQTTGLGAPVAPVTAQSDLLLATMIINFEGKEPSK
jgi:hypothetical protein